MGSGAWTTTAYVDSLVDRGFSAKSVTDASIRTATFASMNTSEVYTSHKVDPLLNPYKVVRECCDSDEHPNTIPVILGLDVTGSMGDTAKQCAAQLNEIMTGLYEKVKDVQFMTMGIGDLVFDRAPIQASQFESDVRILDQMMLTYFEGGGGGNGYESYTAAWYFGLNQCKLDCWKRGKKGIIITMGDEPLNPYLPGGRLSQLTGIPSQGDVDTRDLYKQVCEKYDVYHIAVKDPGNSYAWYDSRIDSSWGELLGDHLKICTLDQLAGTITNIVMETQTETFSTSVMRNENGEISW